jgi:hypothetical protein
MKSLLFAVALLASTPTFAGSEPTEADFNAVFKNTIAMAVKQHAPIKRFNDETQVGWSQVVRVDNVVTVINAVLSPGTTFAIKHLCIGDVRRPNITACSSNLGETWIETKGPDGQWRQSHSVNLSWHRDLSQVAFD